ncbi:MAG: SpoIID/LytB domain-containing protein [Acidobacteriota bacterium]
MRRRTAQVLVGTFITLVAAAPHAAGLAGLAYLAIDLKTHATRAVVNPAALDVPVLPGSVMKIATIAAALESAVVGERTGIMCTREVSVAGHRLVCTHPDFHRPLRAAEALAFSCNVFAATVATRTSRSALDRALTSLGLPASDTRWPVAASGLGVEGNHVTPRGLIDMMVRITAEPSSLAWNPTTLRVIREGLHQAAQQGTASALAERGVDALAKTGTVVRAGVQQGLVVGVTPSAGPSIGFFLVGSGVAGMDAAALAAERLAAPRAAAAPFSLPPNEATALRAAVGATLRVGVIRDGGRYEVRTMAMEEYVAGVVAGEAARGSSQAALEALAITVRTFATANRGRHHADGFDVCDLTHCQALGRASSATRRAAESTAGQVLLDHGHVASVYYSASCGGMSERPSQVWAGAPDPSFLPAANDEACQGEPAWVSDLTAADLLRALKRGGFTGDQLRGLTVVERNASGRVRRLALAGLTPNEISGESLRTLVGRTLGWQHLKSTAFAVRRTASGYSFAGHGSGHGVGLCVLGSSRLAARGMPAERILSRYFPGLALSSRAPRVDAAGNPLRLVLPEADEGARATIDDLATKTRRSLEVTLGVGGPESIVLRFHPTVESYQRATGQPWFTTAATVGHEIHLVPLAVLRQRGALERTVRHELVHVLADSALADRPLWVREGAAMYFAGERPVTRDVPRPLDPKHDLTCPTDAELRHPASRDAMGVAYVRAVECFARAIDAGKKWTDVR